MESWSVAVHYAGWVSSVMKLAIHCSKRYDVQCLMCVFTCGQRSLPRSCKLAKNTLKGKTIGHEK